MANNTPVEPSGTKEERLLFRDVHNHYTLSKEDLETRITRKNGFDDADKMFASHIDESNWPYKSMVFDPRPYTVIVEKSGRLIGAKPKGRLVPREGGDSLGAVINNELLDFQWDDNSRLGESMVSKWIKMDQGTRKYGKKFALCKWKYECRIEDGKRKVLYDGPDFVVCKTRDVLANPSYEFVNKWFQYREYLTLNDLKSVNDAARTKPIYKNLKLLQDILKTDDQSKGRGDKRETDNTLPNKSFRGLTDYLGSDEVYKTIEIVTEYRPDRWITFAPRQGVIIRDIPNPYKHGQIPVVELCYYPLEDDLYGVNEFEPVASQIRAINSFLSQFSDDIVTSLYPPLMINPVNVKMHTIEFTPEAKWLMNNPGEDVKRLEAGGSTIQSFNTIYSTMVGSLLNAWGENSQGFSQVNPTQDQGRVTATEIKDTAITRNVRDNMNQIFLSEALKKQILFWHSMNQQFLFSGTKDQTKIIRVVGRDAVDFFKRQGLADIRPTDEDVMNSVLGKNDLDPLVEGPRYPVETGDGDIVPKFVPDEMGGGDLYLEQGDLLGTYDYIPDTESMKPPSDDAVEQKLTAILGTITNPAVMQQLQMEGKRVKIAELLIKMFESTKVINDAEAYFEDIPQQEGGMLDGQVNQGGAGIADAGQAGQGNGGDQGLVGGNQAVSGVQDQPFLG